jgi:hypothetical protein
VDIGEECDWKLRSDTDWRLCCDRWLGYDGMEGTEDVMHCELSSTVDESGASPSRLDTSIDPSGTVDAGLRHHSNRLAQCLLHL